MTTLKLTKIGTSTGAVIPKEMLSRLKVGKGDTLMQILESRLDNVVYRLGFGASRASSRQTVLHGHILVNGRNVNIPSYIVKPGDVIQVRPKSRKLDMIHDSMKRVTERQVPVWLQLDKANLKGTFMNVPERADVPLNASEQLVVELYSK